MLQHLDTTTTARHAELVRNYLASGVKVTVAIREAYKAGDWSGIDAGLAILPTDEAGNKKAASLRSLVRRETDSTMTVRNIDGRFHVVPSPKTDQRDPSIASKLARAQKAMNQVTAVLRDLEALEDVEGIDEVLAEFRDAHIDRRDVRTLKAVKTSRLSAIRVVHDQIED